ncbi:MAG: hypothetical protein R3D62_01955 [Xanthobacteraceae bacterium]
MNVPEEFYKLCIAFYPHSHEEYTTEDEWIAGTLKWCVPREKRSSLKRYLDELLSARYSDADLAEAWSSTSPTYNFRPGGHRIFLTKVRDRLAKL